MSEVSLVSRVTPVHTAVRNCTVTPVERRGRVIAVELGPTGLQWEEPEISTEGGSIRAMPRAG
jgi:hypothetical protein